MKEPQPNQEPSLSRTLIDDFKDFFRNVSSVGEVKRPVRRSFRELREFYIDQDRRKLLASKGFIKRWFLTSFWLFKALLLKLRPVRRVLLVVAIFFLLRATDTSTDNTANAIYGGLILLLLLMFELKDKLLAHGELQAGHAVQKALLPPEQPLIPGWEVWLYYRAANEVGGDLLDFQKINANRYGIALGDVADKGLKAALLMAKLQATLRALAPDYDSLAALAAKINQISHRDSLPTSFASLIYLELPPKSGEVRFFNAGHMPLLVVSGATVRELAKGDVALGLTLAANYSEHSLQLQNGDFLIAYSDGVTEAQNESGQFFGEDKFAKLLRKVDGLSARQTGEKIVATVAGFVGDAARTDDLSLAILRRI